MIHTYLVYGLVVQSEIELPELLEIYNEEDQNKNDVAIICEVMPQDIRKELDEGKDYCFQKDKIWFYIKNTAVYYIKNINCIQVEVLQEADEQSVKTFLLGSALGMLLIMRKTIAIHGGAVVIGGESIIVTGESGAGKSTLTAALREKGYKFLADDVSALGEDENSNIMVMPGYPQQKLCKDAVEKFNYANDSSIKKIDEGRDKYSIKIRDNFGHNAVKLKAIYELSTEDIDGVRVRQVRGKEKLTIIFNNIFRFELIKYIGMNPAYFKKCARLAQNIQVYKITRPNRGYTIEEQVEIIESSIGELAQRLYDKEVTISNG